MISNSKLSVHLQSLISISDLYRRILGIHTFPLPLHGGHTPLARVLARGGVERKGAESTVRHLEVVVWQALCVKSLHLRGWRVTVLPLPQQWESLAMWEPTLFVVRD